MRKLTTPLTEEDVKSLHAGEHVLLSGVVYTARDAAHLRMMDLIRAGKPLPVDLAGQVIYYAGPTPHAARTSRWFHWTYHLDAHGFLHPDAFCNTVCAA